MEFSSHLPRSLVPCLYPQLLSHKETKASRLIDFRVSLHPLDYMLWWGQWECECSENNCSYPPLGLHLVGVALFFSLWLMLVFVFHLWMDKLFLHVLCILKQNFNYTFSTVLMWTYEQLSKVQINAPHFQLFVTIFAFLQNILRIWSPTSAFCRLFWNFCQRHGQCCESWEEDWSLYNHCLGGCVLEYATASLLKLCVQQERRWDWFEVEGLR